MIITTHPRYDIDKIGIVRDSSSGDIVQEVKNRRGLRSVKIKGPNHKWTIRTLDRLMLNTYKPLPPDKDPEWMSVRFLDGNRDNIHIDNLEWSDEWYYPPVVTEQDMSDDKYYTVPNYPELEISLSYGISIRNTQNGNIYSPSIGHHGYLEINVPTKGTMTVHRLLAITFLAHPIDVGHLLVNHKDSIKTNNAILNLEWTTHSGNNQHSFNHGTRNQECKKILLLEQSTGIEITCPSINHVARLLGSNPGMIHSLISHRQRRGCGYKGYLVKLASDKTPWEEISLDTQRNSGPYTIAVMDLRSRKIVVYKSLMETIRKESLRAVTIYRLLTKYPPEPYGDGRCMQPYNENGMNWPNYPEEVISVYSNSRRGSKPFRSIDEQGNIEYASSLADWCNADRENRCDPATLSREIKKNYKWRDWKFEFIDLNDYIN